MPKSYLVPGWPWSVSNGRLFFGMQIASGSSGPNKITDVSKNDYYFGTPSRGVSIQRSTSLKALRKRLRQRHRCDSN